MMWMRTIVFAVVVVLAVIGVLIDFRSLDTAVDKIIAVAGALWMHWSLSELRS